MHAEIFFIFSGPALSFGGFVHKFTPLFRYSPTELPLVFFLLYHDTLPLKAYKKSVVRYLVNIAYSCIMGLWKCPFSLTIEYCLHCVRDIRLMEDLTSSLKDINTKFYKFKLSFYS